MKMVFDIYTAFKTTLAVTQIFLGFLIRYVPVYIALKKKKKNNNLKQSYIVSWCCSSASLTFVLCVMLGWVVKVRTKVHWHSCGA